jgi:hypothetical protein
VYPRERHVVDVMDAAGGPKEEEVIECLRYSINASWRLQKYGPEGKAYGYPKHSTSDLRYLCACHADLDFDRLTGLTYKEVIGRISEYQADGKIPPVSATGTMPSWRSSRRWIRFPRVA